MSRAQQEKLTDKEIIERYTPKVFWAYARNVLLKKARKDKDSNPEHISQGDIHWNGTSVKKIIRLLYENDVLTHSYTNHSPRINIDTFNKQAPAFAHLDMTEFQLDIEATFLNAMGSGNPWRHSNQKHTLDKETLGSVGGKGINKISISSTLWAFYNQDKVSFYTPNDRYETFMYLKNREAEVARSVLLTILFHNLRYNPTKYMAEFYGTAWAGKVSAMPYIKKHDALTMIKSPLNIVAAEKEMRMHAEHFLAYANMLKHIKDQMRGDRATHVTEFLKFMIDTLLKKAPLNMDKEGFKAILEHAADFTFENLFPNGLTKEQIDLILGKMKG